MLLHKITFLVVFALSLSTLSTAASSANTTAESNLKAGVTSYLLERQKQPLPDAFISDYSEYLAQQLSGSPYVASVLGHASRPRNGKPFVDLGIIGDARYGGLTPATTKQGLKELIEKIQLADPLANAMFYDLWLVSSRPDGLSLPADIESMLLAQRPSGAGALANIALIDGNAMLSDLIQNFTPKKQRRPAYIAADTYRQPLSDVYFIKAEYFPDNGDTHYTEQHWFWHESTPSFWPALTTKLTTVDFNRIHERVNLPPAYAKNITRPSGPSLRFTSHGLLKIDDPIIKEPGLESDLYTPSVKIQSLLGYAMVQPLHNNRNYFLYFNDFINAYSERCSTFIENKIRYTTRADQVTTQDGFEIGRVKGKEHTVYVDERYLPYYKAYTQRLNTMRAGDLFRLLSRGQNQDAIASGMSLINRKNGTVEALIDTGCDSKVVQVVYRNMLHETGKISADTSLRY
ncbi:MAG: hypothetical protein KDI24_13245 [Pseudomonadales bacterium]|jgi:hypothetical protein|nr:hypothetical protein [Pseudomonadales bacterium]MCP5171319.1 hypothetical protein [Pseudomonadales bacterium]